MVASSKLVTLSGQGSPGRQNSGRSRSPCSYGTYGRCRDVNTRPDILHLLRSMTVGATRGLGNDSKALQADWRRTPLAPAVLARGHSDQCSFDVVQYLQRTSSQVGLDFDPRRGATLLELIQVARGKQVLQLIPAEDALFPQPELQICQVVFRQLVLVQGNSLCGGHCQPSG